MNDMKNGRFMNAMMNQMREHANNGIIESIKNGEITIEDEDKVLPAFLSANLVSNPQILEILEVMAEIVMEEDMKKEYVIFFLNKIREIANKSKF